MSVSTPARGRERTSTERTDVVRPALRTVLTYAIVATLWIVFSDRAALLITTDPDLLTTVAVVKGILFVAVTSGLLYVLVRNDLDRIRDVVVQQRLLALGAGALRAAPGPARAWATLADVIREGADLDLVQMWMRSERGDLVPAFTSAVASPAELEGDPAAANPVAADDPALGWLWDFDAPGRLVEPGTLSVACPSAVPATAVGLVPVRDAGSLLGAIAVTSCRRGGVTPATLKTVAELASQLGNTLVRFRLQESLQRHALYDDATGLPNRALLSDRLQSALRDSRLGHEPFMVLMCELDQFDTVSQSFSHEEAEHLLAAAAGRLQSILGPRDTLSRTQSREFTVIARDVHDFDSAASYLERLDEVFAEPAEVVGSMLPLTVSVGVHMPGGETTGVDVLRETATALHRARTAGRGHRVFFDAGMRDSVEAALHTEIELRRAIDSGELEPYFQPLISARDRRIIGAECLIRWQHPTRGLLGPDAFIQIAEDTGLIVPIGRRVVRMACEHCARWPADGTRPALVSVNLSAAEFSDPLLVEGVLGALHDTGLDPSRLSLEITETAVMARPEHAQKTLGQLREIGVRVAVDDFGTGYSSLAYLRRFPLDAIKVDRAFVSGVPQNADDATITRTIVEMTHALGLLAVAEGVETEEQAAFIVGQGFDALQGYLFGKPMPPGEFEARLAAGE